MTLKEVREKIKEAKAQEWFENVEMTFKFATLDEIEITQKGYDNIYSFITRQTDGWNELDSNLPNQLKHVKTHLSQSKRNWLNS